jgi:type I restriction enzyme S subunit
MLPLPPLAEQKRIVAKIEELLPLIDRYEKAWSKLEDFNKRFPVDMQKSLLQMAIQGKLVEQRAEEGTGEELYCQIQAEKQRLIKSGKIKKEKPLPAITEDEIPFDIPDSWKWVRLGQLGNTNIGLTYGPKDVCDEGVVVLRSSNIQNGKMDYADIVKVSCSIPESKMCHVGDILICARNGSKRLVGKAALIDRDGMSFGAFMAIFRSCCNAYVLYVINSAYFRNALLGDTGTTTINQITQDVMKNMLIPLPPLAEQKRIVAKLEELLPLCERLK